MPQPSHFEWNDEQSPAEGGGRLRHVSQFAGTRVTVLEGNGKDEILREVVHYFDEYGNHVSAVDPFPGGKP